MKTKQQLELGLILMTRGVASAIHPQDVQAALGRHRMGDWGECGQEDWAENDHCLTVGDRILSVYRDRNDTQFWVLTEHDRSSTTVLLPDEY